MGAVVKHLEKGNASRREKLERSENSNWKGFYIGFFCIIYSPNSRTWTFILPFKSIEMTATSVVALGGRLARTNMAHGDMKVQEWWAASM